MHLVPVWNHSECDTVTLWFC